MLSPSPEVATELARPPARGLAGGLRECKKARLRAAIRQEAMRLFREQGWEQTTVEQIAEAAEVSPSTFFRYFPTKEDVVLLDEYDGLIVEDFRAQPPELTPLQAMRKPLREVFANIPPRHRHAANDRLRLPRTAPHL